MHTFIADDVVDAIAEVQLKWLMDLLAYGFIKLNGNDCNHGDKTKTSRERAFNKLSLTSFQALVYNFADHSFNVRVSLAHHEQ